MLCLTILFHHLVCVCVLHLSCVYVITLSYHHSIFVIHPIHFIYHIPSRSFHLPYSISFISSTIFHLVHFIYHTPSRSFHPPYSISFISSTIVHLVHFIYHSPSRSFYWSHIVHHFHICHIWPYSCSIVIQSYFHVRLRNTILFKYIC